LIKQGSFGIKSYFHVAKFVLLMSKGTNFWAFE